MFAKHLAAWHRMHDMHDDRVTDNALSVRNLVNLTGKCILKNGSKLGNTR